MGHRYRQNAAPLDAKKQLQPYAGRLLTFMAKPLLIICVYFTEVVLRPIVRHLTLRQRVSMDYWWWRLSVPSFAAIAESAHKLEDE